VSAETRTAAELAEALAAGETSSVAITQAALDRIAEVDGDVHAFLHVDTDGALRAAAESWPATGRAASSEATRTTMRDARGPGIRPDTKLTD
jgi:Asp-tRNA(Asn)/Glu-tRNA(Gln) amidotransferase A subunit family amidase